MNDPTTTLGGRLARVRARIDAAIQRRGEGGPVRLVGVSKTQPVEAVRAAAQAGLVDLGENYAQELRDKRRETADLAIHWHFIGPVQSNKVKYVVGTHLLHSLDRPALLDALEARARKDGVQQAVLVQVNVAEEAQKSGARPDDADALLDRFADCEAIHCRGLMVIPPLGDPEATRPHFRALARLRDRLAARTRPRVELAELSMGMSADFEVAIEEGATLVRVGTAIFGTRG